MQINQLTATDTLTASDLFPVWKSANGDARKAAASVLLDYMQDNLTFTSASPFETQYAAPSATAFSVTIAPTTDGDSVHLILTPVAGYADGTIVLPLVGEVVDKQEVLVNCTQAVTNLVVDGNGAVAVTGEPSTLAANAFFRLKYDAVLQSWFRVG